MMRRKKDDDNYVNDVFVKQMSAHLYSLHDIVAYGFSVLDVIWIFSDNVHIRNFWSPHEQYYDDDLDWTYLKNLVHIKGMEISSDVEWAW